MDEEMQIAEESAGEMLQRLGTDGMLWAQEMNKHFPSVSVADFLGWCCNMIEAGGDRERRKVVYDGSGIFFISTPEQISEAAYERLKKQIDNIWPLNVLRPIFLEGCEVKKL